jgi:hypothetical protein
MSDETKKDEAAQAAEEAAREAVQAGELAVDALGKALAYFSPARRAASMFARVGRVFSENGFRRFATGMGLVGDALCIVVGLLFLALGIGAAIKLEKWVFILYGIGLTGLMLALQYISCRFIELNERHVRSWPTRLGIPVLPGALAWLASVAGLLFFIWQLTELIQFRAWQPFWLGFGVWFGANLVAWSLMHAGLANVAVEQEARGAGEALDIASYLAKQVMRVVPMVFGFAVIGAVVWLIVGMVEIFRDGLYDTATDATLFVVAVGFLPVAACALGLAARLVIGLCEAILSLAGRNPAR